MWRRSDCRARRGKPPCFARTQYPVGSRPGSVNRCLPPQVEAPPPSPAQLLFDHALALEQQTDFFSDLAREAQVRGEALHATRTGMQADRKSTRLNSSHSQISYAVFCLQKKKKLLD